MNRRSPIFSIIVVSVIGVTLSLLVFYLLEKIESERNLANFRIHTTQHAELIRDRLVSTIKAVKSIAALYAASEQVTRKEFSRFIDFEMQDLVGIQAIEWIPRVEDQEREEYEALARNEGLANFRFTERNSQGEMVTAARRDRYFPVYFLEPLKGNEAAIGFDLASNPTRLEALNRARDTGLRQATARINLVQESGKQYGVLVFQPVYRSGKVPETVTERRQQLSGFALGVFRIGDIIGAGSAQHKQDSIEIFVFDEAAPPGQQLLFPMQSSFQSPGDLVRQFCLSTPLTIGGRSWQIVQCRSGGGFASYVENHTTSLVALIAALFITILLALYMRNLAIQRISMIAANTDREATANELLQLIDSANAPIFGIDLEGRINEWNLKATTITGFTKDEVMGRSLVEDFIGNEFKASVKGVLDRALNGEETANYEFPLYTKLGDRVQILLNSTTRRDSNGSIIGVIGIGQDITELRSTLSLLESSEARFSALAKASPVAIYIKDLNGRFLLASQAYHDWYGIQGETKGKTVYDFFPEADADIYSAQDREVIECAKSLQWEIDMPSPDSTHRSVLVVKFPIYDRNGEMSGVGGINLDLTERKKATAQIIQATKLATLGEMATSVAHELNQPLNVIRMASGNVQRKLRKGNVDSEYLLDKLERIEAQTERASSIITHMQMFGRKADDVPSPIHPCDMMTGALDMMGEQLRLEQIEIRVGAKPESCPLILGHRVQLEQVILNLLTNAQDAILSQHGSKEKWISLAVEIADPECIKILVEDSGGGIPDNVIERIFEPFYTTKEIGKGTGLGLSVSYGIIRDMGGSIEVSNGVQGARFTITLPIVDAASEAG